jgi:peptidoglycan/LPS O-acetylase OafA/YrhL
MNLTATEGRPDEKLGATSTSHGRLLVLDGLRGVAAFGVINDHVASETLRLLSPGRYLAVDFFWVLSGFVLALAYDERLKRGGAGMHFMRIRLIRFYPLYALGLVIAIAISTYGALHHWGALTWPEVALASSFAVLFVPFPPFFTAFGQHIFPLNGPSYSLFYELVVNAIYGFVARFLTVRALCLVLAVSAALIVWIVPSHEPGAGWRWPDVDAGFVRVIYCFFAGVLLFRVRDRIRVPTMPAWMAVAVYLAIIAIPVPDMWRPWYNVAVILLAMPLLVASASKSTTRGPTARIFALMGVLSYGVYVLHVPLLGMINLLVAHFALHPPGFVMVLAVAISAAVLAWLANTYFDLPLRRWLAGKLGSRTAAARAMQSH